MQQLIDIIEQTRKARLEEPQRPYLGCSEVGNDCDRAVWLSFRHATPSDFTGRHYGMFRRGHQEEEFIKADLEAVDLPVMNDQAEIAFSHHFKGHIDGELVYLGQPTLLEAKCLSAKRVRALKKSSCKVSEPTAYAQMQLYMLGRSLTRALYYAVEKDTDNLYLELIDFDREFAERHRDRGLRIIDMPDIPPAPYKASGTWYKCKMCKHHGLCWDHRVMPQVNCRTCMHSTPGEHGWHCEAKGVFSDLAYCTGHQLHPGLVPWTFVGQDEDGGMRYEWDGREFVNGENGFSSRELTECFDECRDASE
jgi:hypothetical protein